MQTIDRSPIAPASPHRNVLWAALTGISLLAAGWSSPGLAAAHLALAGSCDDMARNLQSSDVASPAIELVDLSDVTAREETSGNLAESVAPLLFLTPRVASILQDVFGDSAGGTRAARAEEMTEAELEGADVDQAAPASPPIVDNAGGAPLAQPASPMYEHAAILPRFQRQMYRTDI